MYVLIYQRFPSYTNNCRNCFYELRQRNIVSLPNPQITQCCLAISPLLAEIEVTQLMVISLLPAAYQSVESVGRLASQTAQLLNGIP